MTLALIISVLDDHPLRAVQSCATSQEAWKTLQSRYTGRTLVVRLRVLNSLLNMKMMKGEPIGEHTSKIESKFSRLASKIDPVSESMQDAILVLSLSDMPLSALITTSKKYNEGR